MEPRYTVGRGGAGGIAWTRQGKGCVFSLVMVVVVVVMMFAQLLTREGYRQSSAFGALYHFLSPPCRILSTLSNTPPRHIKYRPVRPSAKTIKKADPDA